VRKPAVAPFVAPPSSGSSIPAARRVVVSHESSAPLLPTTRLLDFEVARKYSGLYAGIILLAASNVELLKLLPWRSKAYDGYPNSRFLLAVQLAIALEDVPQLCVQVAYLASTHGTVPASQLVVPVISLIFSTGSLGWRWLRKLLKGLAASVEELIETGSAGRSTGSASPTDTPIGSCPRLLSVIGSCPRLLAATAATARAPVGVEPAPAAAAGAGTHASRPVATAVSVHVNSAKDEDHGLPSPPRRGLRVRWPSLLTKKRRPTETTGSTVDKDPFRGTSMWVQDYEGEKRSRSFEESAARKAERKARLKAAKKVGKKAVAMGDRVTEIVTGYL